MATRVDKALAHIEAEFDSADVPVFRKMDIAEMLSNGRASWKLPVNMSANKFIEKLSAESHLKEVSISFSKYHRVEKRYVWRSSSTFALAQSLGPRAYLSHFSAIHLHALTNEVPRTVYVNREQSTKPKPTGRLQQGRIDAAFSRKQRRSEMIAVMGADRIIVLQGKQSGNLGVESINYHGPSGPEELRVTNIERTLIDAAVRPSYAGGPQVVLEAYAKAHEMVSIDLLLAMLDRLDYKYPYHQSIGFYLARCGEYDPRTVMKLLKIPRKHDFYLEYGMNDPLYDEEWRLYFPRGMQLRS